MPKYPKGKRKRVKTPTSISRSKVEKDPSSYVLRMLLNASPYYVSGSILAEKLKMSRVGVWSRIDKLRKAGLTIEASQNLGYRLAGEPNKFNLPLLNAWMKEKRKLCEVYTHDQIDSTNNEVERLLANGQKLPLQFWQTNKTKAEGGWGVHGTSKRGKHLSVS